MMITLLLGSIRANRHSHKPALYIKNLLEIAGHEVNFIDLKASNLPVFNDEADQNDLPSVQQLLQSVRQSDGIVLVTPEYNHDISSALKNALDFFRHREFMHKPIGLVATSSGPIGGARALFVARATLPTLGAVLLPTVVQVPQIAENFPSAETCTNSRTQSSIETMLKEMGVYSKYLQNIRTELLPISG